MSLPKIVSQDEWLAARKALARQGEGGAPSSATA